MNSLKGIARMLFYELLEYINFIDTITTLLLCTKFTNFSENKRVDNCREGGDIGLFITLCIPQSLIIMFSYLLAQQHWGLLFHFDRLVHLVECPNISTPNCNVHNLFLSIGDVQQFNGHCVIPLGPWYIGLLIIVMLTVL